MNIPSNDTIMLQSVKNNLNIIVKSTQDTVEISLLSSDGWEIDSSDETKVRIKKKG